MLNKFKVGLLVAASLGVASASAAPAVNNTVDEHIIAAKTAAGFDFTGTFMRLCVEPRSALNNETGVAPPAPAQAAAQTIPDRSTWYARPVKMYDNLIWLGEKGHNSWALVDPKGIIIIDTLYNYASEAEIVDGLKAMHLDPAQIKYVIISHGHGDHDEGAKLLLDRFHAHVIAGAADWDLMAATAMAGGVPARDMVATEGQKVTVGDTSLTIYLTPGHTEGTLSYIFQVKDHGQPVTVAYSGGTAYNFPFTRDNFNRYAAAQAKFSKIAADAGASVLMSNHNEFDNAYTKSLELAARQKGDPHPMDVGTAGVARYFTVTAECTKAVLARIYP